MLTLEALHQLRLRWRECQEGNWPVPYGQLFAALDHIDEQAQALYTQREDLAQLLEDKAQACERFGWHLQAAGLRQLAQEMRARKTP